MKTLPVWILCNKEEAKKYRAIAEEWYKTTCMWNDDHVGAVTAVAEYLANQDGKTIYECMSRN